MAETTTSSMTDEQSCIICEHLGSSSEIISDFGEIKKITRGVTVEHIPDEKTIKKRLIERFNDDIVISTKFRSNTIICFKKINHDVLTENWYSQRHNNKEEQEFHILKAASKIIRRDIRAQVYDNENYTPSDKMLEDILMNQFQNL